MRARLSFLEVEVTNSLSSNVVKGYSIIGTGTQVEDKRIIDTNTLAAKKMEVLASVLSEKGEGAPRAMSGFMAGLLAEDITDKVTSDVAEDGQDFSEDGEVVEEQVPPEPVLTAEDILREANYKAGAIVEDAKAKITTT